jgi:hypothetical protein
LIAGLRTHLVARAAGVLLTVFAPAMSAFTGPKSAFDYSVWSATIGAFLLSKVCATERAEHHITQANETMRQTPTALQNR